MLTNSSELCHTLVGEIFLIENALWLISVRFLPQPW
jgi:hypothetical protein